jgi:hypothetical protein
MVKKRTICHLNMLIQEKPAINIVGIGLHILIQLVYGKKFIYNHLKIFKLITYGQEIGILARKKQLLTLQ